GLARYVRLVVSGAEPLDALSRRRLEAGFSAASVVDYYVAAEDVVALSCRFGHLHPPVGVTSLRLVSMARGRARVILTQLQRRTQPVLGFDLDDVVRLDDDACACGHP